MFCGDADQSSSSRALCPIMIVPLFMRCVRSLDFDQRVKGENMLVHSLLVSILIF